MEELTPFGYNIRKDSEGRICLTDIWNSFGADKKKSPYEWLKKESTIEFIDYLKTLIPHKKGVLELVKSSKGKYGATYADKQLALTFAKWLSPEAHKIVNDVFFERLEEEKNPQLAIDRAINTWKKKGKTEEWISTRLNGKAARLMFTTTLGTHGVKGIGFRDCTNAIYKPLWGGTAALVRVKKNLPEKSNTRENMTTTELLAVSLAESLASDNIKKHKIYGNIDCRNECFRTGTIIADAVKISLGTR